MAGCIAAYVGTFPPALLDCDPSILAESPSCLLHLLPLSSPPSHGISCSPLRPSPQPLIWMLRFKRSPSLSQPATIVFARALSPRTTALGAARRLASSHGAAAGAASNVRAAPQRAGGVRSCSGRRRFQQAGNNKSSMHSRQFWHLPPNKLSPIFTIKPVSSRSLPSRFLPSNARHFPACTRSTSVQEGGLLLWWLWTGSDTDAWSQCDVLLETYLSVPQTFLQGAGHKAALSELAASALSPDAAATSMPVQGYLVHEKPPPRRTLQ